jgi:hypothetical protein
LSRRELAVVKERTRTDGLCLLGLRFSHDRMSPADRFSVLTRDLSEDPPNSALEARRRTVEFLRQHLTATWR